MHSILTAKLSPMFENVKELYQTVVHSLLKELFKYDDKQKNPLALLSGGDAVSQKLLDVLI
jgi:hypothetical protein